jgi:hypothetical protein
VVVHRDYFASGEARGLYDCGAGVGGDDDAARIKGRRERKEKETQGAAA